MVSTQHKAICCTRLPEVDVHPVVAGHEVAVVGLPVLELHEHGVVLGRAEQGQRQHGGAEGGRAL